VTDAAENPFTRLTVLVKLPGSPPDTARERPRRDQDPKAASPTPAAGHQAAVHRSRRDMSWSLDTSPTAPHRQPQAEDSSRRACTARASTAMKFPRVWNTVVTVAVVSDGSGTG